MEIKTSKQLEPVEYWYNISNYHFEKVNTYSDIVETYEKLLEFIKQKLELWMIIPSKLVNGKWEVLEKPECFYEWLHIPEEFPIDFDTKIYQEFYQAESKVLFSGFEYHKKEGDEFYSKLYLYGQGWFNHNDDGEYLITQLDKNYSTIQDILYLDLELTDNAKKQL